MTGLSQRHLEPEILDGLAADDPRALASRRDLYRINALMFQARIMASLLRKHVPKPPTRILEIGGGDGRFMLAVARRLAPLWPGVELVIVDRLDLVTRQVCDDFGNLGWWVESVTADIFDWTGRDGGQRFDAIAVNLFLHHFDDGQLADLFSWLMPMAPLLVATEPLRARLAIAAARLLWAIGANDVTRNDAVQSVRAGFCDNELSDLWSTAGGKPVEERRGGLFTHAFVGACTGTCSK